MTIEYYLCIGGSEDGNRVITESDGFKFTISKLQSCPIQGSQELIAMQHTMVFETYFIMKLRSGAEDITFAIHESLARFTQEGFHKEINYVESFKNIFDHYQTITARLKEQQVIKEIYK